MNAVLRLITPTAFALLAAGCASLNPPPPVDVLPTTLPPVATLPRPAGPVTGGLFHTASYRPAFEDQRARLVGDLVTIKILEKIDAKQNSKSNVNRTSDVSGGITALPLVSSSLLGKLPGKTTIGAGYGNTFEGKGDTLSKNEFDSNITALVTEVLPNGHLVIAGEKQVGVNRSVDVLRFSGIVDPRRLQPGSIIDSQYVANVRVISRGLGEQAEAQAMGWLTRAFNTITPF
ncbi:flagellar biosynthesis protein FlgH [Acidovorax carolinensis]|uniref:Flagellar L-ring protein n=1 Tax=Acidovorax carolinensis TaxID=553814 RepID=A0A240UFE3_9BURK|nr:flagellar basal body L-ring protein FlgH [Acidovorax carolinensis]ART54159.1 flagellar biosynthesis protein FlgH [Acidovorax carolinensis]ART60217.1 flagellar biosynthesis protein FlgH [Acidovorax carolinensis]